MATTKKVFPYELLVRWDHTTGAVKGYHLKAITTYFEDGKYDCHIEGDAMSATAAKEAGYDFSAILDTMHAGALMAVDDANIARDEGIKAAEQAKDEAVAKAVQEKNEAVAAANAAITQERDAALAEINKEPA